MFWQIYFECREMDRKFGERGGRITYNKGPLLDSIWDIVVTWYVS